MSSLINSSGTTYSGGLFTNNIIPKGGHTLAPTGTNIQSAAGIYPCASQKGGKEKQKRKLKNKMSIKYKMRHSKRTKKMRLSRRRHKKNRYSRKHKHMRGGRFQPPMTTPNYTAGHSQYGNNNGSLSNSYSRGGILPSYLSSMANPAPYVKLGGEPDNLNHNTLNANGNIGAGSGFPSRGWF